MATVHFGRLVGPVGFSRTVAIKRLHAQFANDPDFVTMFLDEARVAARIRHPNVVQTQDVVATGGELFLVMDYVPGESLSRLTRNKPDRASFRIISAITSGVLHGLHAAHEATDEKGVALGIVHRDVSPQNVLVGTDGVPKILDFGVAKAAGRIQTTRDGQIKGKLAYMPPEQLRGATVTRACDIYAVGVIIWELITGQRLFSADNEGAVVAAVLDANIEPPSEVVARNISRTGITSAQKRALEALDRIVLKALAKKPEDRYATAREMALELERVCPPATGSEVGDWVERTANTVLRARHTIVAEIEAGDSKPFDVEAMLREINTRGGPNPGPSGPVPHMPGSNSRILAAPAHPGAPTTQPVPAMPGQHTPPGSQRYPMQPVPHLSFVGNPNHTGVGRPPTPQALQAHELVRQLSADTAPIPPTPNIPSMSPITQPSTISVTSAAGDTQFGAPRRSSAAALIIGTVLLGVTALVALLALPNLIGPDRVQARRLDGVFISPHEGETTYVPTALTAEPDATAVTPGATGVVVPGPARVWVPQKQLPCRVRNPDGTTSYNVPPCKE